jgi:hypothetical protein
LENIPSVTDQVCLSRIRIFSIPDPIFSHHDPDPDFLPIPDPGSRGQKGTGYRIRIRDIEYSFHIFMIKKLLTAHLQILVGSCDAGLPGADYAPHRTPRQVQRVARARVRHLSLKFGKQSIIKNKNKRKARRHQNVLCSYRSLYLKPSYCCI